MIHSEAIRRAYGETQSHYSHLLDNAAGGDDPRYLEIVKQSRLNDYAYFVLFWGQFETAINKTAEVVASESLREIDFMARAALCVGLDQKYYDDIYGYYEWRCDLAHGRISDLHDLVAPIIFDRLEEIADAIEDGPVGGDDYERYFTGGNS